MAWFIFLKNFDNIEGTLYKIAENESDLNNLNIHKNNYKIIEDSQINFNDVKHLIKRPVKYNDNTIIFSNDTVIYNTKENLSEYINNIKSVIKLFLNNNPNHTLFNRWNNYYNQLNSFNLDSITYPLNKSLEKHFNDLGQPSYNILQIP